MPQNTLDLQIFEFSSFLDFILKLSKSDGPEQETGLSVLFAPAIYRVVKITCSCSEVVLQTKKHSMVYPGSGPSLEVIALRPAV
jgi:hypothetical protein